PPWCNLYHMSEDKLKILCEDLDNLLKLKHIRHSTSPYGAPLFFVKQNNKLRLVFDYRALNKITVKNRTALPNMKELMDRLKNATVFSKIDLQSGFHQIRIVEEDKYKTAFRSK